MPIPNEPNFKVYDPRRGEDWSQKVARGRFSSRKQEFLVIDYWPGRAGRLFEFEDFERLIATSIVSTGNRGFVTVAPFSSERARAAFEWNQARSSAMSYFALSPEMIRDGLEVLRQATYEDCVLGSCRRPFDEVPDGGVLTPVVDWNLELLLTQADRIGAAALYGSETGIIRVLTRIYSTLDQELQDLGARRRD